MPTIGETLAGRYRIDGQLGTGGMATVHRGHDLRLGRDVAIKVLLPNLAGDPSTAQRFDREARSLAALSHPNVVAVFDVEPADPAGAFGPFFVMELCDGGSLADRMAEVGGRLRPDELVPMVAGICDGLAAIHEAGLVHRDVKPHNVLIAGGRPKLGDLGLARPEEMVGPSSLTDVGTALGTLGYLAPERLAGVPATPASDVWSLGALVFQGLTGTLPRPSTSVAELVDRRLDVPPPVSVVAPDLGPAFDQPVGAALEPEPSLRSSPVALASGLVAALGRWSHDGGPARWTGTIPAVAAMLLPPGGTSAAAADAITARAIPVTPPEAPVPYPASTLERISRPASRTGLWLALLAALAIGLGALVVLTSLRGTGGAGGSPTPSAAPKATRSASASAAPSPTPKPTADAFAPARSRLADLRDAIAAASGGHGIKGREANELQALLAQEQGALDAHDAGAARATADQLIQTINDDIQNDKIGEDQARSLVAAAQALRGAVARL